MLICVYVVVVLKRVHSLQQGGNISRLLHQGRDRVGERSNNISNIPYPDSVLSSYSQLPPHVVRMYTQILPQVFARTSCYTTRTMQCYGFSLGRGGGGLRTEYEHISRNGDVPRPGTQSVSFEPAIISSKWALPCQDADSCHHPIGQLWTRTPSEISSHLISKSTESRSFSAGPQCGRSAAPKKIKNQKKKKRIQAGRRALPNGYVQ